MRKAFFAAALTAAAGSTCTLAQFAGFEPLNTPNSGLGYVLPTDLNADGTVVAGYGVLAGGFADFRPIRRLGGQPVEQLGLYDGETRARAYATNANGAFIVGGGDSQGFWWVPPGPNIGSLTPPLLDVNDDGSVFMSETTRYAGLESPADFPNIPGYTSLRAARMNGDGNAAAISCNFFEPGNGYGYPPQPSINIDQAARWTPEGETQGIGFLPGGNASFAVGISADGAVVVGRANVEDSPGQFQHRPFRWSAQSGMVAIPMLPGSSNFGEASDASANGGIIVGESNGKAFIWDAQHGTRDLQQLLISNGHDLTGWTLLRANAVSDDGNVVAGIGLDSEGDLEGWVADLRVTCTPPTSIGSVSLGVVAYQGGQATGAPQPFGSLFAPKDLRTDGMLAFDAPLQNGMGSCYAGVPGVLSPIAFADAAPFLQPSLFRLTSSGRIAIRDLRAYFPGPINKFLYYGGTMNAPAVLAQSGDPAPQTGGGVFDPQTSSSSEPFLNGANSYALQSVISGGNTGVAAFATVSGTLTRSSLAFPPGITQLANPRLIAYTDSGAIVRKGNLTDSLGPRALLLGGPPPASSTLVVSSGTQVPGEPNGVLFADVLDTASEGHSVAFFAPITSGATVLCTGTQSSVVVLARTGGMVDGIAARTIQDFIPSRGFALLPSGDVLFVATIVENQASATALLRASSSGVTSLVRGGVTKLPGYAVCRAVNDLSLVACDGGNAMISATPTTSAQQGMYVVSAEGLTALASPGDAIELAPGLSGTIAQVFSPGNSPAARTGRDGRGTFLSGHAASFSVTVNTNAGFRQALIRAAFRLPTTCPCDLNLDGVVDDTDFTLFIGPYNMLDCADPFMPPACPADFNQDGVVDDADFTIFIVAYNELVCP
ncbi:MAG: hypothetical protein J0L78_00460 [Planctomycetes bacterium]|nr:hypothetical protein [Planctomycetota bacterium]